MAELVLPATRLHAAFLDCHDEWGPGQHENGFGLDAEDDVRSPEGFATRVQQRVRLTHPAGTPCPAGQHGSPRWIVEDARVLGGIVLRHQLDDVVGAIGFGVRPSARAAVAWPEQENRAHDEHRDRPRRCRRSPRRSYW